LFNEIDNPCKEVIREIDDFPDLCREERLCICVLINGTFNHHSDIQGLLLLLKARLSRASRVVLLPFHGSGNRDPFGALPRPRISAADVAASFSRTRPASLGCLAGAAPADVPAASPAGLQVDE